MIRFLGNIESKTDAKGRVFLPSTFRKILQTEGSEQVVIRRDIHHACLVIYPMSAWNRRTDALMSQVNEFDEESQMVFRMYMSEAEELTIDSSGRILIPRRYLEMADIKQKVRFIGIGDTIELWAAENTEKPFLKQEDFAAKLQQMMAKKGE